MKIREDFVTNSSSSSFVLARKGELTQKQKDAVISWVEQNLLGREIIKPGQEPKLEHYYWDKDVEKDVQKALDDGFSIWEGIVSFEEPEYGLANLLQYLWDILEDGDNFRILKGDLDY